eukprot:880742-Pyramimonas_sp.AAC.2
MFIYVRGPDNNKGHAEGSATQARVGRCATVEIGAVTVRGDGPAAEGGAAGGAGQALPPVQPGEARLQPHHQQVPRVPGGPPRGEAEGGA